MVTQLTLGLNPALKSWGCYVLTNIRIFEKVSGTVFTVEEVNTIFRLAKRVNFVNEEAFINKGGISGIAAICCGISGPDVYMRLANNQGAYTHIIARWSRVIRPGEYNSHFVLMEDALVVEWDPYPNSKTVRIGAIMDYRYVIAEAI